MQPLACSSCGLCPSLNAGLHRIHCLTYCLVYGRCPVSYVQWATALFGIAAFVVFLVFLSVFGLLMSDPFDGSRAPSPPPGSSEVTGYLGSRWLGIIILPFHCTSVWVCSKFSFLSFQASLLPKMFWLIRLQLINNLHQGTQIGMEVDWQEGSKFK